MSKPLSFLVAMVYGMAWIVGPMNVFAAILAAREGGSPFGYASTILLSLGIILLVHSRLGWLPFRRKR